jgi:hypothetical protein
MEKLAFTRGHLSNVRVIMEIIRVGLVEMLYQMMIDWIPTLEYLLPDARGCLRPRPVVPGSKCHHFLRPQHWQSLSDTKSPQVERLDAQARPESGREAGRANRWRNPVCP